jgi:hypothetical protein
MEISPGWLKQNIVQKSKMAQTNLFVSEVFLIKNVIFSMLLMII